MMACPAIFYSLPAYNSQRQRFGLTAIAFLIFFDGSLQADLAVLSWPMWNGTSQGILIGAVDVLALLLIADAKPSVKPTWRGFLTTGLALAILLSIPGSSVPLASFFTLWDLVRIGLVSMAISCHLWRRNGTKSLLVGLGAGLTLQAGYVLFDKLSGVVQATGTFAHQNVLGMMTELAAIPLAAAILEGERHKFVILGFASSLLIVGGGGSRGALGFLIGGLFVLVGLSLARRVTKRKVGVLAGGMLLIGAISPFALGTLAERFGGDTLVTEETARQSLEVAAREMASNNWLGVGANQFVPVANLEGYSDRAGLDWSPSLRSQPVHNAYLLARAETGWLGQVFVFALLSLPPLIGLRLAFRLRRRWDTGVALGSAIAIGAIGFHSNYEYAVLTYQVLILVYLNIALILGVAARRNLERDNAKQSSSFAANDFNELPVVPEVDMPRSRSL